MNLGELDVQRVHHSRPQVQRTPNHELPIIPSKAHIDDCPSLTSSVSEATVIRWITPQSRKISPEGSFETIRHHQNRHSVGVNEAAYASNTPLVVRFDEEQIRSNEVASSNKGKMEGIKVDPSPPTPIDDTPYIRFAIDQLTRDESVKPAQRPSTSTSSESYPADRIIPDLGLGYKPSVRREELALIRKHRSPPTPRSEGGRLFNYNATRPLSGHSAPSLVPSRELLSAGSPNFIPVPPPTHSPRYPKLTFVPTILRPASMIMLSILCLLMIAALMFTAIYSTYHKGLTEFSGVYGGQYFVFAFLPQILAACIFVYVQCVMSATTRIMPYTLMAMDDAESRANALFLGIFPRTMLWPRLEGPRSIVLSTTFFWLSIFTIPLQSCLFSVIRVEGVWRWTTVQGIAWTLVAIYILVLMGTAILAFFFFHRRTGLMWDPRSLADIICLLPRSNCLGDYNGTDTMLKEELRDRLSLRSERVGFWMTQHRSQGLFYCIGEEGTATRRYTLESGKLQEKGIEPSADLESNIGDYSERARFASITWYLRDSFVVFWAVAGFLTLTALIIVSFLSSTAIRKGFKPLLSAAADVHGFSPANFLYSFIPAVLGMLLYLLFQSLDMGLRKLQPWADLGKSQGETADRSLLLDYTADLPISCTLNALSGGHLRIAIMSLLSFIFILLPILAGGIFFPLTTPANEVRMIPNLPAFYICITLLILYVLGLFMLVPNRGLMHLPHNVDCLAEIISFMHASHILDNDAAFRAPRSKADLTTRLMAAQADGRDARYAFGSYKGRFGKYCYGIEKLGQPDVRIQL
ncbi:hypothetical protein LCER1_G002572 [Lachnellula cervina]|uniref:Phosphoribosylaminoimidazole-succinocarboxamide synthase n=1 Tax=Lachnellula cervina TaxID=1316786 RepID=A0A7D8YPV8_9HELO|nr:hypothetical protein LCER1_G002572 [Lachnellula cervina]